MITRSRSLVITDAILERVFKHPKSQYCFGNVEPHNRDKESGFKITSCKGAYVLILQDGVIDDLTVYYGKNGTDKEKKSFTPRNTKKSVDYIIECLEKAEVNHD